jgi:succinate dehydrogenase/fumarate reductase flavoprotein subunit
MINELKASGMAFRFERTGIDLQKRGKVPGLLGSAGFVGQVVQGGTGGIKAINTECATNVPGLYASGDSCDTRATGARYPSFGFGLRTASVTGARAGISVARYAAKSEKFELHLEFEVFRNRDPIPENLDIISISGGCLPWLLNVLTSTCATAAEYVLIAVALMS